MSQKEVREEPDGKGDGRIAIPAATIMNIDILGIQLCPIQARQQRVDTPILPR